MTEKFFPDKVFKDYVDTNFDTTNDNVLSPEELAAVTEIDFSKDNITKVKSLTGIEYFTSLFLLNCSDNQLTSLDVSRNTALDGLYCENNQLTSLDVSRNTVLEDLYCANNLLTSLDVSNCAKMTHLYCDYNNLTELNVSGCTMLWYLGCFNNQLTSLDVSDCTALDTLYCDSNYIPYVEGISTTVTEFIGDKQTVHLPSASFTAPAAMTVAGTSYEAGTEITVSDGDAFSYAGTNASGKFKLGIPITAAYFPDEVFRTYVDTEFDTTDDDTLSEEEIAAVTRIDFSADNITTLKSLTGVEYFTSLRFLDCSSNTLTKLDVSGCTALTVLNCHFNNLTELNVDGCTALYQLQCHSNRLEKLDVSSCTALSYLCCGTNQLTSLDVSGCTVLTELVCSDNVYPITLTGTTFDLDTLPEGFDVIKASDWTNATVDDTVITIENLNDYVTYSYNLGNGSTETFTLEIASVELTDAMIQPMEEQLYTGDELRPIVLMLGDYTLTEGIHSL